LNKLITLDEAAALVNAGDILALGGMTLYRRPVAFVRALLHRHRLTGEPNDLTLLAFTAGFESDLLVGSGMVSKVRSCYFGLEIFGLAPIFTYFANRGKLKFWRKPKQVLPSVYEQPWLELASCLGGMARDGFTEITPGCKNDSRSI